MCASSYDTPGRVQHYCCDLSWSIPWIYPWGNTKIFRLKTAAGNSSVMLENIHKIQAHKMPRKTEEFFWVKATKEMEKLNTTSIPRFDPQFIKDNFIITVSIIRTECVWMWWWWSINVGFWCALCLCERISYFRKK